jgi:cell division transport system permease protein
MRLNRSNLALKKDDTNRFLPWIIAFMTLLAALAVAGLLMLKQISQVFEYNSHDSITIQIPAGESSDADEERTRKMLVTLKKVDGVIETKKVSNAEINKLLEPWLGKAAGSEAIPLPQIIDLKIDRTSDLTAEKLTRILGKIIPGTLVDDHSQWLTNLVNTLKSLELIALCIVFLIILATIGTVIFTTRTGMGIHRQTLEVLHFVGAHDEFIARQFAARAFIVGLQGSVGGILLATPILYAFEYTLKNLGSGLLPKANLNSAIWIGVSCIAPVVAIIAMMTARSTVIKTLRKMV